MSRRAQTSTNVAQTIGIGLVEIGDGGGANFTPYPVTEFLYLRFRDSTNNGINGTNQHKPLEMDSLKSVLVGGTKSRHPPVPPFPYPPLRESTHHRKNGTKQHKPS